MPTAFSAKTPMKDDEENFGNRFAREIFTPRA